MITRVFRSGNSQAVRIPKQFQLDTGEVEIVQRGEELIIRPKAEGLGAAFELLASLPDDFMSEGREDHPPQERDSL